MLLTEFDEKAYIEGVKQQSYEAGEVRGETKVTELIEKLVQDGRSDELVKLTDKIELERLYKEYGM